MTEHPEWPGASEALGHREDGHPAIGRPYYAHSLRVKAIKPQSRSRARAAVSPDGEEQPRRTGVGEAPIIGTMLQTPTRLQPLPGKSRAMAPRRLASSLPIEDHPLRARTPGTVPRTGRRRDPCPGRRVKFRLSPARWPGTGGRRVSAHPDRRRVHGTDFGRWLLEPREPYEPRRRTHAASTCNHYRQALFSLSQAFDGRDAPNPVRDFKPFRVRLGKHAGSPTTRSAASSRRCRLRAARRQREAPRRPIGGPGCDWAVLDVHRLAGVRPGRSADRDSRGTALRPPPQLRHRVVQSRGGHAARQGRARPLRHADDGALYSGPRAGGDAVGDVACRGARRRFERTGSRGELAAGGAESWHRKLAEPVSCW